MATQADLDVILNRIRAFRKAADLSYSALALRAELSRAALMRMDDPDWGPTSATIRAIEALIPPDWRAGKRLPRQEEAA